MTKMTSVLILIAALTGCATNPGTPGGTERCQPISEADIAALFERWNRSLQTGDPKAVVANYAERSILLATVSDTPRVTPGQKEEYFRTFLTNRPSGVINFRWVDIGCNYVVDAGLYTFTYNTTGQKIPARYTYTYRWNGTQWLITSHHSSAMPGKP